ncbi:MAG: energy transducer TonB [Candidatus Zixiibacteriota bacterium]
MTNVNLNGQSGYGAFELKATYQRNMMYGTLIMILMVSVITVAGLIYQSFQPPKEIIIIKKRPFSGGTIPLPKINPEIPKPPGGGGGSKIEKPVVVGAKPRPVPMDEGDPAENNVIGSKEDFRKLVDFNNIQPGDDEGSGNPLKNVEFIPDEPEIPDMAQFIPRQIEPEMIFDGPVAYPNLAQMAGMEADVWVSAFIDKNGDVIKAVISVSSGANIGFEEAALSAAYLCKYKPAVNNGYPIAVWVTYKVEFRLHEVN